MPVDVTTSDGSAVAPAHATLSVGSSLRIVPAFVALSVDADLGVQTTVEAQYKATEGRYVIKRVSVRAVRDDVEVNYPTVSKVRLQGVVQDAAPRCIFLTLDDEADPLADWVSVADLTTAKGRILPPAIAAEVVRRGGSEVRMEVVELLYGAAALAGLPPARLLQTELGIPHRTASAWIIEARNAGRLVGMNYNAGRQARQ
ncbi:hypothetical protein [Microbacterium immunditiarum]|uniref:Uncharacterized protein n=1 Tax=Microbacterium immunditiarum TaxID=337480 RepID=A0A7Y9GKF2_9MICO|nr:hypothetical protein [Microbacterium immunditiarum]NYE18059.1 hypothetical protein [Microbacterium immunditiarum]